MSVLNAMSDLTPCYMKIATNEVGWWVDNLITIN